MVSNYIDLSLNELYDLLSKETNKFSEIILDGQYGSDGYLKCRNSLREIQRAIRYKKQEQKEQSGESNNN